MRGDVGAPRVAPLDPGDWREDIRPLADVAPNGPSGFVGGQNCFRTLARHPDLFKQWLPFGGALLGGDTLPPYDRSVLVLRTTARCRCDYEWGRHLELARAAGLTAETIAAIADGTVNGPEALLVAAADELHDFSTLSDTTWARLAERYSEPELIEIPMLVGHFHTVSYALNALGVPLDEGLESLPAL